MRALMLLWLLLGVGRAEMVPAAVKAEIARLGHGSVLVELRKIPEVDALAGLTAEVGAKCRRLQYWDLAKVLHVDATSACLEALSSSKFVFSVELTRTGFIVSANSLEIPRYQHVAILGAGLKEDDAPIHEIVTQEACFCTAGTSGCCPNDQPSQVGEGAASIPGSPRSTEAVAYRVAKPGEASILDGTNIRLLSLRVADRNGEAVSMASVLDALAWLNQRSDQFGAVILSFETDEVFCGPCEGRDAGIRAMSVYLKALLSRGVRIWAPALGFHIRGVPSCLLDVERFPASVDPPRTRGELKPLGQVTGSIAGITRYPSDSSEALTLVSDRAKDLVSVSLENLTTERSTTIASRSKFFAIRDLSPKEIGRNARSLLYTQQNQLGGTLVLGMTQVSACTVLELSSDRTQ